MPVTLRSAVRSSLGMLRHAIDWVLVLAVAALLVRFGLQFHHPSKWDSLWLVLRVRRWGDPVIAEAASWLDLSWPTSSTSFLPLGLGLALWIVKGLTDSGLRWAHRLLEKTHRHAKPGPRPREQAAPPPPRPEPRVPVVPSPPPPEPAPALGATTGIETPGTRLPEPPATTLRPQAPPRRVEQIGRYEILEELGRGAMGVVYKARDPQIGRTVAIKSILAANLSSESVEKYKQRFYVEAQAAGKLSHPGIVGVHDITEDDAGQPCIVIEFVEGTTLDRKVARERLPLGEILDIVIQVAEALDYAHSQGVVHRDIKPANILITRDGQAKVSDFGIAKLAGVQLTQTGQILGTPAFMSPEQFLGAAVDARSDIFSLGSMLYWLCTGEKAFPGETVMAISFKVVHTAPIPAARLNPALPAEIDLVLSRCLAKSPDDRYQTGQALADDLRAFKAGRPMAARPEASPKAAASRPQD